MELMLVQVHNCHIRTNLTKVIVDNTLLTVSRYILKLAMSTYGLGLYTLFIAQYT